MHFKMDLRNQFLLHGPSCLYAKGESGRYSDDEITDFFQVDGDIAKIVRVPDDPDQPRGRTLYSTQQTD